MEYRTLGTRADLSRIAFGCWAIGGHGYGWVDDAVSIRAVARAVDRGITLFDTADVYGFGHSEETLSRGLGARRHAMIVATKFGVAWDDAGRTWKDCSAGRVARAVEDSLRRLDLECIPLYQIHHYDGVSRIEETMEALLRCRDQGKIQFIGCSNLTPAVIAAASSAGALSSIQLEYSIAGRDNEELLRENCDRDGRTTLVYGALMRGLLTGKYDATSVFGERDTRARDPNFTSARIDEHLSIVRDLRAVASSHGRSPAQAALRWVLDQPFISSVIVGIKDEIQVDQSVGAAGWQMDPADRQELSRLSAARQRLLKGLE